MITVEWFSVEDARLAGPPAALCPSVAHRSAAGGLQRPRLAPDDADDDDVARNDDERREEEYGRRDETHVNLEKHSTGRSC